MPSGRTHDAITILLAIPAVVAAYAAAGKILPAAIVGGAFLFGGLMFGPDLDTVSRQYSRWWVLQPMWFPYRSFFKHRSRFSHGLIFGAFLRVVYFMGVLTIAVLIAALIFAIVTGSRAVEISTVQLAWADAGR